MPSFIEAAAARGLVIEHVNTDARRVHRVPVEGKPKTDKTGWYVYHVGGERAYAVFGRWDDGAESGTWIDGDTPLTVAEKKAIQETRQAVRKEAEAGYAQAAESARRVFDSAATDADSHAYLQKKAVKAFGVRVDGDSLLIPLRDAEGVLWGLQRISPDGEKRFHSGGRVKGCFHWLGEPSGASWLLLAEGYATAATIHEATGLPVAVAMNCGNLLAVAEALAAKYSSARFLVCADDDRGTQAKTGKNPGIDAARAVLLKVNKGQAKGAKRARYVAPVGLREGETDFNDLAASAGIDAVRQQIEKAIGQKPVGKLSPVQKTGGGSGGGGDAPSGGERFTVDDDYYGGVSYHDFKNGVRQLPYRICSPLRVVACVRNYENEGWGYLLEFPDKENYLHEWLMPSRLLSGDGNELRSALLDKGLDITQTFEAKKRLPEYLAFAKNQCSNYARLSYTLGWNKRAFVLPDKSISGDGEEKVIFYGATSTRGLFKQKGDVSEWVENVGKYCVGNSRYVFAVSVALSGAILKFSEGVDSGGFHLYGDSSIGKTNAQRVAASIYGDKGFMRSWKFTDNAIEAVAVVHSDSVLILNEAKEADQRSFDAILYMLGNEKGKGRMLHTTELREPLSWRTVILSSGEKTISNYLEMAGKKSTAGIAVRVCDILMDAGVGWGAFETLHGFSDSEKFAKWFEAKTLECYGAVGIAWLEKLVADQDALPKRIKALRDGFMDGLIPSEASGQVHRAANRFALVAAAGEIASGYGLTGWPEGEAIKAAKACFAAWLEARGGIVATEEMEMMAQALRFFEQNHSRFEWLHRVFDDRAPNIVGRCGFKRKFRDGKPHDVDDKESAATSDELTFKYYVLPESFITEVCKDFDHKAMCRLLRANGVLECGKAGFKVKERLPGLGNVWCYRINAAALGGGGGEGEPLAAGDESGGGDSYGEMDCPF